MNVEGTNQQVSVQHFQSCQSIVDIWDRRDTDSWISCFGGTCPDIVHKKCVGREESLVFGIFDGKYHTETASSFFFGCDNVFFRIWHPSLFVYNFSCCELALRTFFAGEVTVFNGFSFTIFVN
jgi:hypothetical protein